VLQTSPIGRISRRISARDLTQLPPQAGTFTATRDGSDATVARRSAPPDSKTAQSRAPRRQDRLSTPSKHRQHPHRDPKRSRVPRIPRRVTPTNAGQPKRSAPSRPACSPSRTPQTPHTPVARDLSTISRPARFPSRTCSGSISLPRPEPPARPPAPNDPNPRTRSTRRKPGVSSLCGSRWSARSFSPSTPSPRRAVDCYQTSQCAFPVARTGGYWSRARRTRSLTTAGPPGRVSPVESGLEPSEASHHQALSTTSPRGASHPDPSAQCSEGLLAPSRESSPHRRAAGPSCRPCPRRRSAFATRAPTALTRPNAAGPGTRPASWSPRCGQSPYSTPPLGLSTISPVYSKSPVPGSGAMAWDTCSSSLALEYSPIACRTRVARSSGVSEVQITARIVSSRSSGRGRSSRVSSPS
jgi:hypothetical protein